MNNFCLVMKNFFKRLFKWKKKKNPISLYRDMAKDPLRRKIYATNINLSPNRGGLIVPKFIILHHSAGSFFGSHSWIMSRESQVSYHFLIDPHGNLTQYVPTNHRAWHAGRSQWNEYKSLNNHSIGISFWGNTYNRKVKEEEIDSCAKKCLSLMIKYNIPLENILTHQMIAPKRKNDPSPATYDRVINRIKALK